MDSTAIPLKNSQASWVFPRFVLIWRLQILSKARRSRYIVVCYKEPTIFLAYFRRPAINPVSFRSSSTAWLGCLPPVGCLSKYYWQKEWTHTAGQQKILVYWELLYPHYFGIHIVYASAMLIRQSFTCRYKKKIRYLRKRVVTWSSQQWRLEISCADV